MSGVSSEPFKIRTRRLVLTPVDDCHVATLVRHWGATEVRRYLWNDTPVTMDMVNDIVTVSNQDFAKHGYGVWAIYLSDDNTLVGACGLRAMQNRQWIEMLFSIRPRYQQRGLATEAARAVLQTAFNRLGLERVVAKHDPNNSASRAVLRRLGMTEFDPDTGKEPQAADTNNDHPRDVYFSQTRSRFLRRVGSMPPALPDNASVHLTD